MRPRVPDHSFLHLSAPRHAVGFILQAIREAFVVTLLRDYVREHLSGSTLTGIRAFSAHLPLIPASLWSSTTALRLLLLGE